MSHPLLSDLILPGASPRALLQGGSYPTGPVPCRCLAPGRHVGLSRFVSAWHCPVEPFSSKNKTIIPDLRLSTIITFNANMCKRNDVLVLGAISLTNTGSARLPFMQPIHSSADMVLTRVMDSICQGLQTLFQYMDGRVSCPRPFSKLVFRKKCKMSCRQVPTGAAAVRRANRRADGVRGCAGSKPGIAGTEVPRP